ncbi:copper amine oxidase N-terminal domain-containing protein [Paenibacillus sp. FSL H8-0457]|uniref:copper amine oxidase N-terminal domain-containing protein n=1 Tax=unclassified Paenibacillus TaxID=185978 RepID=UPI0003E27E9E|nr:copper amine oxidase N-terminal domain-containing protein [Paenibacillus sp. FSL H8-457]ETT69301.1 copper amine oxidase domain-containing protein [Paenibacillus sp. FSL H8-457]
MYKKFKWLTVLIAAVLVVMTGCQAVGGLDINKAMLTSLDVKSSESSASIRFEVVPADKALSSEDKEAIDLINSLSLNIDHAIVEDSNTVSMQGSVHYSDKKVPLHLSMDAKGMAIQLDGAKQPFYLSMDTTVPGMPDTSQYEQAIQDVVKKAAGLVLKHFPNPSKVSVKPVQEKVNGESLNLTHLQMELTGEEILNMVKPFAESLLKDEAGLKQVIGDAYDAIYPMMTSIGEAYGEDVELLPQESKEEVVASLYEIVHGALTEFTENYDEQKEQLLEELPGSETVFGKDTTLKLDYYFDEQLNTRKNALELTVALPVSEDLPLKAVKVYSEGEVWNIGGAVKANKVDTSKGVLDVLNDSVTPGQVLRNFEKDSLIYNVLKDDLKITQKSMYLNISNEDFGYGAIKKNHQSFVPLRYLADQLDAEVKWTKGSNKIIVINDLTGEEIVVTVGSKIASVGGKSVTLPEAPFVHSNGSTYVPLRFMAEALGATLHLEGDGWISVERD